MGVNMSVYLQVAVCFAAIGFSAFLAERTRLFFAPFYIITGFILGPGVFNIIKEAEVIKTLGEIGVVFLLFFLGLEFSIQTLIKQKKAFMMAGLIDFIVNFGLGFGFALLLGLNVFFSLLLAASIYMSSSGIITKSLLELQVNKKPEGQLIMGIMVFEDLAMIVLLALVASGFKPGERLVISDMLLQVGKSLMFCAIIIIVPKLRKRLLDRVVNIKKPELLLLIFFGLVLLVTSLGELFGVSAALTAFFIGIAFSSTENVKRIEHITVTFRDLFGSVFFFSFGMMIQLGDIARYWHIMLICVAVSIAGKLISGFLITRYKGCESGMSLFVGFITIPRGEFSLVITNMAGASIPFIGPMAVFTVMVTTLLSSIVLRVSKLMCSLYNMCYIYPRNRLKPEDNDWGEVD
jgi:CPA2 family monovalent cation:H+ antiporter-2